MRQRARRILGSLCTTGVCCLALAGCAEQSDISFFVLVKSSNYSQSPDGELTLLNYHFFSEVFLEPGGTLETASVGRVDASAQAHDFEPQGDNYYFEGGHFESLAEVDAAHPNGLYSFSMRTPTVEVSDIRLDLSGPGGATDIPDPISVSLYQDGAQVHPFSVDAEKDLVMRWSDYSNGRADPRGIVDDMIFLVLADCHGERVFHTGLPFQGEYTTYRTTEMVVGSEVLTAGHPYSAFVEFPHVADSRIEKGVAGFTSYATATYLDVRTLGTPSGPACPDAPPPMDTGQTDRMDSITVSGRSS